LILPRCANEVQKQKRTSLANREDEMLKVITCIAIAPLAFALALAASDMASAKKAKKVAANPTYEEAWGLCTKQMDRNHILRNEAGQRYAAGAACMLHYGYRI
jgi:hypothetical protein